MLLLMRPMSESSRREEDGMEGIYLRRMERRKAGAMKHEHFKVSVLVHVGHPWFSFILLG